MKSAIERFSFAVAVLPRTFDPKEETIDAYEAAYGVRPPAFEEGTDPCKTWFANELKLFVDALIEETHSSVKDELMLESLVRQAPALASPAVAAPAVAAPAVAAPAVAAPAVAAPAVAAPKQVGLDGFSARVPSFSFGRTGATSTPQSTAVGTLSVASAPQNTPAGSRRDMFSEQNDATRERMENCSAYKLACASLDRKKTTIGDMLAARANRMDAKSTQQMLDAAALMTDIGEGGDDDAMIAYQQAKLEESVDVQDYMMSELKRRGDEHVIAGANW